MLGLFWVFLMFYFFLISVQQAPPTPLPLPLVNTWPVDPQPVGSGRLMSRFPPSARRVPLDSACDLLFKRPAD